MKVKKVIIKIVALILAVLVFCVTAVFMPKLYSSLDSKFCVSMHTNKAPLLVAHRGFSGEHPQNTLVAFEQAGKAGFYGCEFDIHTTKDGEWVVIHDDTVDNMTDGEGEVDSFTLEEIRKLKIDNGNGIENYTDLKVPTLEETLEICNKYDMVPVIEIKYCDEKYLPELKKMLDSENLSSKAVIISFNRDYLSEYREIDKDVKMFFLAQNLTKEDIDWCVQNTNTGFDFNHLFFFKCFSCISYAKQKGVPLAVWTVDSPILFDMMVFLFGAECVTTNKIVP